MCWLDILEPSLYVCTIHQNIILILGSVNLEKDHHELMDMMVFSRDSKECMIHDCKNCLADTQALVNYLHDQLQPDIDEDDEA